MSSSPKSSAVLFAVLGALVTITPFSIDMYLPAFEKIAAELQTTTEQVAFSLSSYFVGLALGMGFYGPVLDRYGRKRPLLIGLGIYVVASLACASAQTVDSLILYRFLQALGACAAQVASLAMVRDLFPEDERPKVFSRLMLIIGISPLFAPTVGGLVVVALGWKAIFGILAFIVACFWLFTYKALPETQAPDVSVRLAPLHILRIYADVFRVPQFRAYAIAGAFSFSGLFAYLAAAPTIFLSTFKLSSLQFSMVFAALSIGMIGGGQFNIYLSRHFSVEKIFKNAMVMQFLMALVFIAGAALDVYGLAAHLVIFFIYISCVGLTNPNAAALAMAPFDRNSGSAAAMLGTLQMVVGASASALFGFLHFGASLSLGLIFLGAAFFGLLLVLWGPKPTASVVVLEPGVGGH